MTDMNRTMEVSWQHQGRPMRQRKIYWSMKDQVRLVECLKLLGRYTFTDEDFVKVAQLMKDLHGIQRTPYQCSFKFKELKRFHPNPVVCDFFGKIKSRESVKSMGPQSPYLKQDYSLIAGYLEEGSSVRPQKVMKMEITLDNKDTLSSKGPGENGGQGENFGAMTHSLFGSRLLSPTQENHAPSSSETRQVEQESVSFYIDTEGDSTDSDSDDDDEDIQVICETSGCSKAEEEKESRVRQEAADTSGTRTCVKCKVSVAENDRFCSNCGQSLQLTKCCECGCEVKLGAKFCGQCGVRQCKE